MNPSNKKRPGARAVPQPFDLQSGRAPRNKPTVAQPKTGVSAQGFKSPVAPPVYRPQATPKAVQPKTANGALNRKPPVAPPVYHPQAKPTAAQAKMAPSSQLKNRPVASPAHNSRPAPQVLQDRRSVIQRHVRTEGQVARPALASGIRGHVIQRRGHRPALNSQVRYQGHVWNVTASAANNPQITIHRAPNHTVHLQWATANFTIIRANTAQDHDLRQDDLGAAIPVDAYDAPFVFLSRRESQVNARFQQAKAQALVMIKATAAPHVGAAYVGGLNALTLDDFTTTQTGRTLIGPSATQAAEWQCNWIEGNLPNFRRRWKFVIDVDNPLPDSAQDPHVGWTVSAEAGTQGAVANVFGHVWLDYVPVSRQ